MAHWRAAFDALRVFSQDFDTAMQILVFQDEKVARLALEDARPAPRARRAKSRGRSFSRKRRRTGASQPRAPPPSPPLSTQASERWSATGGLEESQDAGLSGVMSADFSTQVCSTQGEDRMEDTQKTQEQVQTVDEQVHAQEDWIDTESIKTYLSAGGVRGSGSTMVTSLFTTGSGKSVSVSKERLQAYESKLCAEEDSVVASAATQPVESTRAASSAGGVRGSGSTMVTSLFTTGSGKSVSVSKERLQAYESKLCAEEDSVVASAATQPVESTRAASSAGGVRGSGSTTVTSLFTTGSGKSVSVSKERLQAYESKLCAEEDSVVASAATQPVESTRAASSAGGVRGSGSTTVTSLFTTGSGKSVSVSKERLQAYESKLCAEEDSVVASAATQPVESTRAASSAGGVRGSGSTTVTSLFTTGSGKSVSVSKERLQAYESKLCAEEDSVVASAATQPVESTRAASSAGGVRGSGSTTVTSLFTTGSGKSVSVSKERLQAYESKLCAEEDSVVASAATQPVESTRAASSAGGVRGSGSTMVTSLFTTGSGKSVSVSKERLQAYESKLCAEEDSVVASAATQPVESTRAASSAGGVRGSGSTKVTSLFTTGSGKSVSVSKERLQAYESKLCAEEDSVVAIAATQPVESTRAASSAGGVRGSGSTTVTSLFTTGSGKSVSVSKERLQAYESKLCAEEDSVVASAATQPVESTRAASSAGGVRGSGSTTVTSLFTTGSGKSVSVSKERLQAYESKLCAEEDSVVASAATQPVESTRAASSAGGVRGSGSTTVTSLFTTGSGKSVSVSKERLQAYESKLCAEEDSVVASAATQPVESTRAASSAGGVRGSGSTTVTSLFTTGSGKSVSVSKERLQAYESKLCAEEDSVVASAATQPVESTRAASSAGGVRGSGSTMVTSLFTTGSGKSVSVSKERLQAYESKLCAEEDSVVASAATQPVESTRAASSAGGVRGSGSTTVTSLFTTGSGKSVSVSKERLQAYESKLCAEEDSVVASAATQPVESTRAASSAGGVRGSGSTTVTSLFTTGSGKSVSVSKERLQAYESKLCAEEDSVVASAATQPVESTRAASSAGGVRGSGSTMVTSLFTTGSGKSVSVSKERLQAYESKLCAEEDSVVASAATQPVESTRAASSAGGVRGSGSTMVTNLFTTGSGKSVSVSKERLQAYEGKVAEDEVWIESGSSSKCGGSSGLRGEENCTSDDLDPSKSSYNLSAAKSSNFIEHTRDVRKRRSIVLNTRAFSDREHDQLVPPAGAREQIKSRSNVHAHQDQGLKCGDKENVHPENVLVRKTAALEASKWRSNQLNSRFPHKCRDNQITQQQRSAKRTLKPLLESRSQVSGKKRFRPPLPSKKNPSSITKVNMETSSPSGPRPKKRKIASPEAQPFVYKEAMKISFVVLVGLREANLGLVDEGNEVPRSKVLNSITAENAVNVRFTSDDGLVCSEGPSGATVFTGPHELYSQLKTGGYILEKAGATFAWFTNHYRWIVWKLAAMERSFPRLLLNRYLTKQQVLKQMTYRYQRELNDAQRSILKKILQRDASSLSCMVLCIAAVLPFPRDANKAAHQELPACWNMALVLTDGWYSVYAVPDAPLAGVLWKLHSQSRLIGTKLATWNAVLQNSNDGIDPLECAISRELLWKNPLIAKEDLTQWPYLQLRYNSTRRVSFDTQLGVEKLHYVTPMTSRHRKQQPQLTFSLLKSVPLKSLEVGGGMVRSVRVRVTRISPVLHLQAKEWTLGPRILCEEQLPTYFQLRSEYGRMSIELKHHRDGGDRIIDDWVSDDQIDLPPPIPFIKVDVECSHPLGNDRQGVGCGILTIWRPSEELLSGGLREGVEYFASSLTINWKIDGGHNQDAFLRLSSTKHSGFEEIHESSSLAGNELKVTAMSDLSHRECVDIQQATRDYRTNFENGLNGRRNEKRPTIDVCVCVVLVAARETQDGAMKRRDEVSLLDPALKPNETRYVEHVFVTDLSGHLMSIRVSSMEVSMPTKKRNSPLKQGSSSSFVFRRGSKAIWKEGTIMCLSGLEISHYDEQLRVLDCVLVESTQIISYPSKKSPFWEHFHLLQRDLSAFSPRGVEPTNFAKELTQLKKYVERDILRMDYIPSQECDEHQVEVVEQERLTQDLQAHEEGGGGVLSLQAGNDSSSSLLRNLRWDATIVKISPLVGASKVVFSHDMIAFASVSIGKGDTAFRTVYLTRGAMASINSLLQLSNSSVGGKMGKATEVTATLVQSVSSSLSTIKQRGGAKAFRLEVRHVTNERLINSWKPWERLHSSYWMVTTVEDLPPKK